jgi:hypothetical protein
MWSHYIFLKPRFKEIVYLKYGKCTNTIFILFLCYFYTSTRNTQKIEKGNPNFLPLILNPPPPPPNNKHLQELLVLGGVLIFGAQLPLILNLKP